MLKKDRRSKINPSALTIGNSISRYSALSIDAHKEDLEEVFSKDADKASGMLIEVYLEYIGVLAHLVNRKAFNVIGPDSMREFQNKVWPIVIDNAINSYYVKDSPELKHFIASKLNEAEVSYSSCTEFTPPGDRPFMEEAMSVVLAEKICKILDPQHEPNKSTKLLETNIRCSAAIIDLLIALRDDFTENLIKNVVDD